MLTGSLQVPSTCCKLIFTILTHIINKITIFFPVYLQFFRIFAGKGHFCNYTLLPVIFGLSHCRSNEGDYVVSGRWASFRLGCCGYARPCTFFYLFILAKLTCASATALRGRQNRTESGAIFGRYAQNECSIKLHRNMTVILCSLTVYKFQSL